MRRHIWLDLVGALALVLVARVTAGLVFARAGAPPRVPLARVGTVVYPKASAPEQKSFDFSLPGGGGLKGQCVLRFVDGMTTVHVSLKRPDGKAFPADIADGSLAGRFMDGRSRLPKSAVIQFAFMDKTGFMSWPATLTLGSFSPVSGGTGSATEYAGEFKSNEITREIFRGIVKPMVSVNW